MVGADYFLPSLADSGPGFACLVYGFERLAHCSGGHRARRWYRGEFGEASEVLGGGGEKELVLCADEPPDPEPLEPEIALQVRERHLDLLAIAAGLLIRRRADQ